MAAIVAPGVGRFSINGTYGGQPVATVLDLEPVVIEGPTPERLPFLNGVCERLEDCFGTLVDAFNQGLEYTSINYVDLNSADGLVGVYIFDSPLVGNVNGAPMPGNVSCRINKQSSGFERGQRSGRMYMAGVSEEWTGNAGPNVIQSNVVEQVQTAADSFMTQLEEPIEAPDGQEFGARLTVVHTRRPDPDEDPVFAGTTIVTGLGVQARLASQRRRLTL